MAFSERVGTNRYGMENAKSSQTAIEAMRQKDSRRTHEESPTGC